MEMFLPCLNMQELLSVKYCLQRESFRMVKDEPEVVLVCTPVVGVEFKWPGQEGSALQTEFVPPFFVSNAAAS